MPQKIKKQIKRSMPVFMIFSLVISSTVIGLVFNLGFNFLNFDKITKGHIAPPMAQAQNDTASTTVTVKNAAPEFSVDPAESPTSTSTSPVNVGDAISFNATATDAENNQYYLIICSTNSVTASTTGGPPTCGGTQFCISGLTNSGSQASCTYNNVADPGAPDPEIQEWYAFVCDNHSTEADCSSASQGADPGTADASSPFYVNHAPYFTAVITSDDYKDPGGTFTVTASTSDPDVRGGADEVYLNVCASNNWATSTGCVDGTWCTGTSTTDNVSCSFATTTPAKDGTFSYYAFVYDWHYAVATSNPQTANYHINNVAPTVSGVILHSGENIVVNMKGMDEVEATTTATISDNNGCGDVTSASSTIYFSEVSGANYCTADDNFCYQITNANCYFDSSSCTGNTDTTITVTCSTTIAFHAYPSDGSGGNYPYTNPSWLGAVTGIDDNGARNVATTTTGVDLITLTALDVSENQIAYGSVKGGQNTGDQNATTTVENYGNSPLNTDMSVSDMLKSDLTDWINANNQQFSTSTFTYDSGFHYSIASTSNQVVDTEIPKATSTAVSVTDAIYWGIGIPAGTTSGDYSGTNTFTATLDNDDW
jgi:hypothetical protein